MAFNDSVMNIFSSRPRLVAGLLRHLNEVHDPKLILLTT
ncbi:hypothetical protein CbuD7D7780_00860 [Coxiella burnetii]|uniref:Uncharacterized protein n=1 Tax=Coxiella burnetii (strain Dugway 5J108-111) TaxID=434922 RepID=A9KBF1_COXBN|nr:hypothetical protein [Coxiella burnetii]ABS77109.1 hypothetical protein CBUD_0170 [Coxiella burnetii Dugway 5J108-111]OYK81026.1 hypothetical protein CbuD7E6568_00860 [Coxiella burnetii]OYK83115.1 hypothetical protein CbuD7D7780_00860 [Coxiella burnetii]